MTNTSGGYGGGGTREQQQRQQRNQNTVGSGGGVENNNVGVVPTKFSSKQSKTSTVTITGTVLDLFFDSISLSCL